MSAQSERDGPASAARPGGSTGADTSRTDAGADEASASTGGASSVGDVGAFTDSTFFEDSLPPPSGNAFDATLHTIRNLGRYGITEELGDGAMSRVYKAFDPRIQRFLAVKVLHEQQANEEEVRLRLSRIPRILGVEVETEEVHRYLRRLGLRFARKIRSNSKRQSITSTILI